jgi:glycosyltransferase involved in cell wall biosynthesis
MGNSRVCMIVHHYFPRDVRVRREALALADAGFSVTIIALRQQGEAPRENWRDLEVVRLPIRRHRGSGLPIYLAEYLAFTAMAGWTVRQIHSRKPFGVVHVHTPPDFLIGAGLPARLGGAKLILDDHDLTPELYGSRFGGTGGLLARALTKAAERGSCAMADRVITVTDAFKDLMIERGTSADKILVLHNCADHQIFDPDKATKRSRNAREFVVMHHGTMLRRYGEDLLLEAFAKVLPRLPNARLAIYGDGDLLPELQQRAAQGDLQGRVTLYGEVTQEEIAQALVTADLSVVPNRQDELLDLLLPTKVLEALQMGCPVLASSTKLLAETFRDGGIEFVPPGDVDALAASILRLAQDPRRLAKLRLEGLRQVAHYSWNDEKQKLIDLYHELGCG